MMEAGGFYKTLVLFTHSSTCYVLDFILLTL